MLYIPHNILWKIFFFLSLSVIIKHGRAIDSHVSMAPIVVGISLFLNIHRIVNILKIDIDSTYSKVDFLISLINKSSFNCYLYFLPYPRNSAYVDLICLYFICELYIDVTAVVIAVPLSPDTIGIEPNSAIIAGTDRPESKPPLIIVNMTKIPEAPRGCSIFVDKLTCSIISSISVVYLTASLAP